MKKIIFTLAKTFAAVAIVAAVLPAVYTGATVVSQNGYGIVVSDNKLEIPKQINLRNGIVENTPGTKGNFVKPEITFTYQIVPATIATGTIVTDSTDSTKTMHVYPGIAAAVSLENDGKVEFTHEAAQVASVEAISSSLIVDIDPSQFTTPGVYRYLIDDTTSIADLYDAGIVRTKNTSTVDANGQTVDSSDENRVYVEDRYLDIFIKEENGTMSIAGYVLMKNNPTNNTAGNILKSEGFTVSDQSGYDSYRNYFGRVSKNVAGGMGDKNHEFPFVVEVDNNGAPFWCGKDPDNLVYTAQASYNKNIKLKHGEIFYLQGLSPHAKVSYSETNDTTETYIVKAQVDNGSGNGTVLAGGDNTQVAPNGTLAVPQFDISNYEDVNDNTNQVGTTAVINTDTRVIFTNTIRAISPTGVILRFAPFVMLFAFAIGILAFSQTTKKKNKNVRNI